MAPAAGALTAGALDEVGGAGAVTLHGASEVVAEETAYAVGVAYWRVEEADPQRVGPAPDSAGADAIGHIPVEHGQSGGIGAEQPGCASLLVDDSRDRSEQVDVGGDTAAECLRRQVGASALESQALPLDRLMLGYLSAVASTINVVPSLPRSTISAGTAAQTMVSSLGALRAKRAFGP